MHIARMANAIHPGNTKSTVVGVLACLITAFTLGGCASSPSDNVDFQRSAETVSTVDPLQLLREATDHEGLYTLAGGLKPMSTGIWRGSFEVEDPDLTDLREARQALGVLRNDVWYADVQVFEKAHEGERSAQAFVVHRKALARMIERHQSFWSPWGITAGTHPAEIVAIVDRMPRDDRWRGYGYLFGYPDHAVDFFVEAGLAAEDGREVGPGKDRQFIQIPTSAADSGRFTYAVPPDHVSTDADQRLANDAAMILAAYTERKSELRDVQSTVEELRRLNSRFEDLVIIEVPTGPKNTESAAR